MQSIHSLRSPTPGPMDPGPEMTFFATVLDECLRVQGSAGEKRLRLLKLVDVYHQYALEQYRRTQKRGKQLAEKGSSSPADDVDMDLDDGEEGASFTSSASPSFQEAIAWKHEAQTWDLLRHLLPSRYPDANPVSRISRLSSARPSSKSLWHEFIESDATIAERKAVLDWLQNSALDAPDIDDLVKDLQQNADRGDIVAHGWIHTRFAIKSRKRILGLARPLDAASPELSRTHVNAHKAPLVTQLDPDSTTRQGRHLEPQDEYFERATWLGCYELLRRGCSSDTIREWCEERTEGWRAVSMSALTVSPQNTGSATDVTPEALALWRRTCLAIARQTDIDDYERAVYGILSGDIATVERVCRGWDDFVFAHYNAIIRSQFDSFVLSKCSPEEAASLSQSFVSFDAAQLSADGLSLEKRLVSSLEQSGKIASEAREANKVFQAAILAKEVEQYFFEQGLMLGRHANKEVESKLIPTLGFASAHLDGGRFYSLTNHGGLRIISHAYIIISQLEKLASTPAHSSTQAISSDKLRGRVQQNLVSAYISLLRLCNAPGLIPLYCSTLDDEVKYETLCRNLIYVTGEEARLDCISLVDKAGLDKLKFVQQLASMQMDAVLSRDEGPSPIEPFRILQDGPTSLKYGRLVKPDFFGDDPDKIDTSHELLIRSIEWLSLVDEAWPDLLSVATKTYTHLLRHMHLNAARQLAQRVPFAEVLRILGFEAEEELEGFEPPGSAFWLYQLSLVEVPTHSPVQITVNARVFRDLEWLVRALDTMETLASLAELSREDPAIKREFWTKVAGEVKAVKENMSPMLDGWLLTAIQGSRGKHGHGHLADLRRRYLPEVVLAYISSLHFAGTSMSRDNLLECMDLAAVIAQKDSDLATCFVEAGRMTELVEAFASCSKALAIMTGEKKMAASGSKKLREMGWSRDLWSVNSGEPGR